MFFDSLPQPWQVCVSEAWNAFQAHTVPIGACVVDIDGNIIAHNRNHIMDQCTPGREPLAIRHHKLAHAELNTLLSIQDEAINWHQCAIYSTVEPCPLCMGAIYMMGIRTIHFATTDPWAGSTNLLGTTWYLSVKPVVAHCTTIPALETIMAIMNFYYFFETGSGSNLIDMHSPVIDKWQKYHPVALQCAIELYEKFPHYGGDWVQYDSHRAIDWIYSLLPTALTQMEVA